MSNSAIPAVFFFAYIVVILLALNATNTFAVNTPQQVFTLKLNETFTVRYQVHNVNPLFQSSRANEVMRSGYIIASTGIPGTYLMNVTTDRPEDEVHLAWAETYREYVTEGDKFEQHTVLKQYTHWYGSGSYYCVSNRYSDCSILMSEGNYAQPELQVYIHGMGSGNITITRTV